MNKFFEVHYGDIISIYLFHLGIALLVVSAFRPNLSDLNKIGWSLVVTSMATLKLKGYLNGDTKTLPSTTTSPTSNTSSSGL